MRRTRFLWLLALPAAALFVSVLALGTASATTPAQGTKYPIPECVMDLTKSAVPEKLYVGDEALVTSVISGTCPAYDLPIDLVLVVDKSNSMTLGRPDGPGIIGTPDPNETPGTAPRIPTGIVPGPAPTKSPGIDPNGDEPEEVLDEAMVARVRGVAQLATLPPSLATKPAGTPLPGIGGGTPTPGSGLVPRDEVEAAGTEDNIRVMQQAVADFLEKIQPDVASGKIRVALVSFDDRAHTLVPLTDSITKIRSQLTRIRGGGNSRLDLGLQAAQRELVGATTRGRTDLDHTKAVMVWTDGQVDPRTVARMRTRGNLKVFGIGVGRNANMTTLRRVATEASWVYKVSDQRNLLQDFQKLAPNKRQISIPKLDVLEELTGSMELVAGSVNPAPSAMLNPKTMSWHFEPVTLPLTMTYRVRPLEAGTLPVAVRSKVTYTDSERRAYDRPFPDLLIEVLKAGGPLQQP
jgi:uncharacterized protein YegL